MFYSEPIQTTDLCEYGCGQVAKFKNKKKKMCSSYHTSCPTNKNKNSNAGRIKVNKKIKKIEPSNSELCAYGCGQVAQYINGGKKKICSESSNSCPELRRKNSESLSEAYKQGIRRPMPEVYSDISVEIKNRMNWNKGNRYADFSYGGKGNHKGVLIQERGYKCECCNLSEWMNKPIPLELEHTDADRKNNTRENLKLLCLNCHGQTPTWKQGNLKGYKVKKYSDEVYIDAIKTTTCISNALKKLNLRAGSATTIVKMMGKYKVNFLGSDEE